MGLNELQNEIYNHKKKRGFNTLDVGKEIVLMTEELGELAKAYRDGSKEGMAEEISDLMIYCLGLCEILGLDSEKVITEKMEENKDREHESCFEEKK